MNKRILLMLVMGLALSGFGSVTVSAWPDFPPDKAVLSGPGISGEVEITEPDVLGVLRLAGWRICGGERSKSGDQMQR